MSDTTEKLSSMTKEEKSLLLFFETCAVDHGGLIDIRHMNDEDMETALRWGKSEFVRSGRVASECLKYLMGRTHWCELSDEAWDLAHAERRERYKRINSKRTWYSTEEKRANAGGKP